MQTTLNITVLEQLVDRLQACFSIEEAARAITPSIQQLFPNEAGAIYILRSPNNLLEAIATWGPIPLTSDPIVLHDECIALQRGEPHLVEDTQRSLLCQHVRPNSLPVETLCVPIIAHGDPLGVLYIGSLQRGRILAIQQLAARVAKHIGLALANLKLRETLKSQSLRDPLTKLYNRRYLEESLEREIHRTKRSQQPLGIILLALDRFEAIQQKLGLAGSELLLREIGLFLPNQIRSSDIACRYRGEEFLLLLPEACEAATRQRAEQIRENVKHLALQYKGRRLDFITFSCGFASLPTDRDLTGRQILRGLSAASNQARAGGGDRAIAYTVEADWTSFSG
jgi:diguanylate cyclase (GGDEF)-like protein